MVQLALPSFSHLPCNSNITSHTTFVFLGKQFPRNSIPFHVNQTHPKFRIENLISNELWCCTCMHSAHGSCFDHVGFSSIQQWIHLKRLVKTEFGFLPPTLSNKYQSKIVICRSITGLQFKWLCKHCLGTFIFFLLPVQIAKVGK